MFINVIVFVILNILQISNCLYHDHIPCSQDRLCRCVFPDGTGIDLSLLVGHNFSIPLSSNPKSDIKFWPCSQGDYPPVNATTCHSVSLCLVKGNDTFNIGTPAEHKFVWESISQPAKLQFVFNGSTSNIELVCDPYSGVPKLEPLPSSDPSVINLQLVSQQACLRTLASEHSISILGVLFIIFVSLFLFYCIVGFCVLKFIRGAEGIETIPNHDFWLSIPTKAKFWLISFLIEIENHAMICCLGCLYQQPVSVDRRRESNSVKISEVGVRIS